MSKYIVDSTSLTGIANIIREKAGTTDNLTFPTEFNSVMNTIPSISVVKNLGNQVDAIYNKIYNDISSNSTNQIEDTLSDQSIASFSDGADGLPMELTVGIVPVQSGTGDPSPMNIRPISGWTEANVTRTGKNLIQSLEQGSFNSLGQESDSTTRVRTSDYIKVGEGKTYTVSGSSSASGTLQAAVTYFPDNEGTARIDASPWQNVPVTVETPTGTEYVKVLFRYSGDSAISVGNITAQLEIGSSASTHEDFAGNDVYPITFPSQAGTVYGGTLTLNQDGSGSLVVDRASDDMGSRTWIARTGYFVSVALGKKAGEANILCENYKVTASTTVNGMEDFEIKGDASNSFIYLKDSRYSTTESLETALSGVKLVYELDTPGTYSLTPGQIKTLLGQNNIWADTGDILSVKYPADTKLYMDKTFSSIKSTLPFNHTLTINYLDTNNNIVSPAYSTVISDGWQYNITSPTIQYFTPNTATVSGTMGASDVTTTVTYTRNTHTLTINYEYADNSTAAQSYTGTVGENLSYSVNSPEITDYTPDLAIVSGTMGTNNVIITVTYTANSTPEEP